MKGLIHVRGGEGSWQIQESHGASFLFTFVWVWAGGRAAGGKDPGDGVAGGRKLRPPWRSAPEKAEGRTPRASRAGPPPVRKAPQHGREDETPCWHPGSPSTGLRGGTLRSFAPMNGSNTWQR